MHNLLVSIAFPPEDGELQTAVYNFATNFPGEVTVVARHTPDAIEADKKLNVNVVRYGTTPLRSLILRGLGRAVSPFAPFYALYHKSLKAWIAQNKPSAVHCMHINTAMIGHLAKKDFGIPYFVYCFGQEVTPPYLSEKKILSAMAKPLFENADRVYCANSDIAKYVVPFVTRQDKVREIPWDKLADKMKAQRVIAEINHDLATLV